MSDTPPPHPLDADDDDDLRQESVWHRPRPRSVAYQPLLRPSLLLAGVALIVLFLSSVGTIALPLGTSGHTAATAVFRVSGVTLIVALGGVLFAFRVGSQPRTTLTLSRTRRWPRGLLAANLAFNALLWVVLVVGSAFDSRVAVLISGPLNTLLIGLLVTMIIWHQGSWRAFAIGSLCGVVLQAVPLVFFSLASVFDPGFWQMGGRSGSAMTMRLAISQWIAVSVAQATGLICAAYVRNLESQATDNPQEQ